MRLGVKVMEEGECLKSWIRFGGVRVGSEGTENLEAASWGWLLKLQYIIMIANKA